MVAAALGNMKQKPQLLVMSVVLLCACWIHGSGVVARGENRCTVTRQSGAVWVSVESLKAEALQEAGAYCAQKQKQLKLIHSKDTPAGFGRWADSGEETFKFSLNSI